MAFGTYPTSKSKVFYIFIIDNLEKPGFGSEPEQYRAMLKKTGKPGHDRALGVSVKRKSSGAFTRSENDEISTKMTNLTPTVTLTRRLRDICPEVTLSKVHLPCEFREIRIMGRC